MVGMYGLRAAALLSRAKPVFLGQTLNFSGRSQQPKNEKKYCFLFIRRKSESILSSEMKCLKSEILLIIIGWDESGKAIIIELIQLFSYPATRHKCVINLVFSV